MSGNTGSRGGRTKSGKPRAGTGGKGRDKLEGKGPTPPAHLRPGHPAQRAILSLCERVIGEPLGPERIAVDGCGIPVFATSLRRS